MIIVRTANSKVSKAIESGSIISISISADHSAIVGGHASGHVFTWDVTKPAKPLVHITPVDRPHKNDLDGHISGSIVLHVGFLGIRNTSLVSADDKGMAFSHFAARGLGVLGQSTKTTRILGRYPDGGIVASRQKKPSTILAFSPLPLGDVERSIDSLGMVAMLTPYLLVIVSTTPFAQTQHKTTRSRGIVAHGAMSGALAWFPAVKLKASNAVSSNVSSNPKLVYCWSNVLTVLDVIEVEQPDTDVSQPPAFSFRHRSLWKATEAIVAIQWLSRSVLGVLTITQRLLILEDVSLHVADSSDLVQRHVYHADLFSQQLSELVDNLDEEDNSMHGVVADAFYMSFRAYKGRLFLLGHNELSFGVLSNWADRLLALMEDGNFIGAIKLAVSYYNGDTEKLTVGLPDDEGSRHKIVRDKIIEMMSASLRYAFGKNREAKVVQIDQSQLQQLSAACITACISIDDMDFLFEDAYAWYQDSRSEGIFIETLEPYIIRAEIAVLPPSVIKDLIDRYVSKGSDNRLEEIIYQLDARTIDIDQITSLCKQNHLYDALLYVWNQVLGDYTTILTFLLDQAQSRTEVNGDVGVPRVLSARGASRIFPYLSHILTGRFYPTGTDIPIEKAVIAKADVYNYIFSSDNSDQSLQDRDHIEPSDLEDNSSYSNLRRFLDIDAPSFLSMLNEAFEDGFLNSSHDSDVAERSILTEGQRHGLSLNRQWIVSILLEILAPPSYGPEDTIYLDMFVARNLAKYPQFILLPSHVLHRVLIGLCRYPTNDLAEDSQLSTEYLLSLYHPANITSMIPSLVEARFYRVLKSIYKAEKQYALLLETCFADHDDQDAVFEGIRTCLGPDNGLNGSQQAEIRAVLVDHVYELATMDVARAALTVNIYAQDLHRTVLDAMHDDEELQIQYLCALLEKRDENDETTRLNRQAPDQSLVEQYIRLLCDHDPQHVTQFVDQLRTGDLRLEKVLPALESSGVIDAAVMLMARDGDIRDAMDRLIEHLKTIEAALTGLFDGLLNQPADVNMGRQAIDLVDSVQKYSRIGIWLCRRENASSSRPRTSVRKANQSNSNDEVLSKGENLWLDLLDAVVGIARDVTKLFESWYMGEEATESDTKPQLGYKLQTESTRLIVDLRTMVQDAFTALLSTTSTPDAEDTRYMDLSFLRIFRAFLGRASLSSPSLSHLRGVLNAIFSAYSYEESLLTLATQLLEKDLWIRVDEADYLRRKGWRPLGQVCEACGRRVWGPGAGGDIWDAWAARRSRGMKTPQSKDQIDRGPSPGGVNGKGKGVLITDPKTQILKEKTPIENTRENLARLSALIIFSCRHIYHQRCLQDMRNRPEGRGDRPYYAPSRTDFECPTCS